MKMQELTNNLEAYYQNAPQAQKIIINCALTAAGATAVGGLIPVLSIPATIVASLGAIWAMYIKLSQCLDVPFKENSLKVLASAALSNIATNLIGVFAIELLGTIVPGFGCVAGAALTFACVYLAGLMFMKMLLAFAKKGMTGNDLVDVPSGEVTGVLNDCKVSKEDVKDAKKVFTEAYHA